MELTTLHSEIRQKHIKNFYIFTGAEIAVQNIYINQIANCKQAKVVRLNTVQDVCKQLGVSSMFRKAACYVVRDDTEFSKAEKSWQTVINLLDDNVLILCYTKVDNRALFFKRYKDAVCEFKALSKDNLKKYLAKKLTLSDRNSEYFISICESDYSRIMLESDKVRRYADSAGIDDNSAFRQLVIDGTIHSPAEDVIFDWVNAVLNNKKQLAWELYYECREYGTATLPMITLLYNNAKQTLQVQLYSGSNIEKGTGLTAAQIRFAKQRADVYSDEQLLKLMRLLHSAEMGIKRGLIEDAIALDVILIKFFNKS